MRALLWLSLLLLLSACQGKGEREGASPRTLPVERPELTLSVLSDSAMVARAGGEWARHEGVDLKLLPRDVRQAPPPEISMIEREDGDGQPWLLAPSGLLVRLDLLQAWGHSLDPPDSWQALAVLVKAMNARGKRWESPNPARVCTGSSFRCTGPHAMPTGTKRLV